MQSFFYYRFLFGLCLLLGHLPCLSATPDAGRLPEDTPSPVVDFRLAELREQDRRGDPDSIRVAADALWAVAPPGSPAAVTAAYHRAAAQLVDYDAALAAAALHDLQRTGDQLEGAAKTLHEFYQLAAEGHYNYAFAQNYERAAICYINALRNAHLDPALTSVLLQRLAGVMNALGQYPLVQRYLERYRTDTPAAGMDALDRINYEGALATFHSYLEEEEIAFRHQQEALRLLEVHPVSLPYKTAAAYLQLASIQYGIKKNKRCRQYIDRAHAIRPSYGVSQSYIPVSYHLGDYAKALTECRRALVYLLPGFGPTDDLTDPLPAERSINEAEVAYVLRWKARILYKQALAQKDETALPRLRAAIAAAEQARLRYSPYLVAAEGYTMTQHIINRSTIFGQGYQMRAAYEIYRRTQQPEDLKRFFYYTEMRKNYLLSAAFDVDHLPPAQRYERQMRMAALEELEYRVADGETDSTAVYERRILRYSRELDSCIVRMQRTHPRPVTDQAQLTYADPDAIQAGLDERTVFVEYTQQWQHWYAYVITAERQYAVKLAADFRLGDAVEQLIRRLKDPLQTQRVRREELVELSHYVYQKLLQPLEADLAGKERLLIVPERDLCLLPFEVLLANKAQLPYAQLDYLINDFEISYHASGTLYEQLRARPSVAAASFFGFAPVFTTSNALALQEQSVDFFPDASYVSIREGSFTELPGTETELRSIAALLPDAAVNTLVLHREATAARLGAELREPYRYVHIATHGFYNFYDPRLCAFATYAADGRRGDYFFAHETNVLDFNPDLLVLSSCESGVGRIIEGENVTGLSRAFMAAGAKNILYSLWKVNDRYSGELMIDFYKEHLGGTSYAAALRAAKLRLLADPTTAAPRYWAPFVLTGE